MSGFSSGAQALPGLRRSGSPGVSDLKTLMWGLSLHYFVLLSEPSCGEAVPGGAALVPLHTPPPTGHRLMDGDTLVPHRAVFVLPAAVIHQL